MKEQLPENYVDLLKQAIEKKIGRTLRTPADFDFLILRMEEEGADTLSLSTLKRIWNYVPASSSTAVLRAGPNRFPAISERKIPDATPTGIARIREIAVTYKEPIIKERMP